MEMNLNGGLPKTAAGFRELILQGEKPGADGALTARERLLALFDEGSFTEIGAFSVRRRDALHPDADEPEGVLTGYGAVDGCLVYAFAQDLNRTAGAVSDATADKIERLYHLAVENGCPVVGCFDSAGADLVSGVRALGAYGRIMKAVNTASGVIPQIAVISGIAQGASAVIAAMFDFVVVTDQSVLSVSPAFAVGGGKASDSVESGTASLRAEDEADAFRQVRALLGYLPSNNEEGTVEIAPSDDPDRQTDLSAFLSGHAVCDLLKEIADNGAFFELGKGTAPSLVTGFLSLDGTVTGVVATDRSRDGGRITSLAARKAAKFVSFCDCFRIPLLTVVDSEGFALSADEEKAPYCAEAAKLAGAYAGAGIPLITLNAGAAYGSVFSLLGSGAIGADVVFALASAEIGCMNPASAVAFLKNDQVKGSVTREQLEADYAANELNVIRAAMAGEIDDIVEDGELRQRLISAVLMLSGKASSAPKRRHANMPL